MAALAMATLRKSVYRTHDWFLRSANRGCTVGRLYGVLAAAVVCVFLISHVPIFVDFPIPRFRPDWGSYFQIILSVAQGEWPDVSARPPFYPMFVAAVLAFGGDYTHVVIVQSAIFLAALLYAIYVSMMLSRTFGVLTGIAAIAVVGRSSTVRMDNWILTEPVYATLMVLCVAFLVHGLAGRRPRAMLISSLCAGFAIWTKPAALWLVVLLGMAALYMLLQKYGRRPLTALLLPVLCLSVALATYNAFSVGKFSVASNGGANLIGSTWFYWEPSARYSSGTNEVIRDIKKRAFECDAPNDPCFDLDDVKTLRTSMQLDAIADSYQNLFGSWPILLCCGLWEYAAKKYEGPKKTEVRSGTLNLIENPSPRWAVLRIIGRFGREPSLDAIAREPSLYLKTVAANHYRFYYLKANDFWAFKKSTWDKILRQMRRYKAPNPDFDSGKINGHCDYRVGRFAVIGGLCDRELNGEVVKRIKALDKPREAWPLATRLYGQYFEKLHAPLFAHRWWGLVFAPVLLAAGALVVVSRGRHDGAVVALIVTSACIGSGAAVNLIAIANRKYAEPSVFFMLWGAACVVMLLPRMRDLFAGRMEPE